MDDLFLELAPLRDELASVRQGFGVFNYKVRSLIVCYRRTNAPTTYLEIQPRPLIDHVDLSMVAAFGQNIKAQIELSDLQVTDISRQYTRDQLLGSYYIIDGVLADGVVTGGIEAERLPGSRLVEKTLTWELLLRERPPSQRRS
jgi:hypothetical protein